MRVETKGRTKASKAKYYREYMRERRQMFKEKGGCVQCGQPVMKNHTLCEDCAIKQRNATNKYHNKILVTKAKKSEPKQNKVVKEEKRPMIEIISVRDMTPEEKAEYERTHPIENIKKLDRLPIEIVSVRDLNS